MTSGEVTTYRIPHEEIVRQYGEPGPKPENRVYTRETVYMVVDMAGSLAEAARMLKVDEETMRLLMLSRYVPVPMAWHLAEARKKISREEYLELKVQGLTDKEIARQYGIKEPVLYQLKKEWGLKGRCLPVADDNQKPVPPVHSRPAKQSVPRLNDIEMTFNLADTDLAVFFAGDDPEYKIGRGEHTGREFDLTTREVKIKRIFTGALTSVKNRGIKVDVERFIEAVRDYITERRLVL